MAEISNKESAPNPPNVVISNLKNGLVFMKFPGDFFQNSVTHRFTLIHIF